MRPDFLAVLPVTAPVAVGIGVAALVGLYLVFKVGKFVFKLLLVVAVLAAIGGAAWWYWAGHHG